jgi:hypothetical protein
MKKRDKHACKKRKTKRAATTVENDRVAFILFLVILIVLFELTIYLYHCSVASLSPTDQPRPPSHLLPLLPFPPSSSLLGLQIKRKRGKHPHQTNKPCPSFLPSEFILYFYWTLLAQKKRRPPCVPRLSLASTLTCSR